MLDPEHLLETLRLTRSDVPPALADWWSRRDLPGLTPWIASEGGAQWMLRRLEGVGAPPPDDPLLGWLRGHARSEIAANMIVDAEAEALLRLLADRGVPCILIKGTARRAATTLYPYADARATRDVDVLLPAETMTATWQWLRDSGWPLATDPAATPTGHYHPPPLLGPNRVGVELHESTGHAIAPDEAWRRANEGATDFVWHGLRVRVPGATELLWHGLTHALHHAADGFRLRHFLDGAAILASGAAIDWDRVASRLDAGEGVDPPIARAWLSAAAELGGVTLPLRHGGPSAPFDLGSALTWRLAVLGRFHGDSATARRLVDEGTRVMLGMGASRLEVPAGSLKHARRWLAGRAARVIYRVWRVLDALRPRPTPPLPP